MAVVCITGATGFIGSHLAKALPDAQLFPWPDWDLRILEHADRFIDRCKPDIVFHLAAQSVVTNSNDLTSLETNIAGTYNLLHACLHNSNLKSFVHISTDKVYGDNCRAAKTDPLIGVDHPYNASKLCGDVVAQMYASYFGLPIRIIRTGNIYGPGDTHLDRIIPETITKTLKGERMHLRSNGEFMRDYIYIDDLIPAYLRIANEPPGVYNLGGVCVSVIDLVKRILWKMGREDLQPIILNNQQNEIPYQHVVDCPDWWERNVNLDEGIERTIEWYSSQA